MPMIYVKDESVPKLKALCEDKRENRSQSDEIDFLLNNRLVELGLPANINAPSAGDSTKTETVTQE